jgi:transcription initiation factor TFIID subunit 6
MASSSVEKIAAQNIRQLLVKSVSPVLKSLREPPDNLEEFRAAYGSLGPHLLSGVERARKQSGSSKQLQQQQGGVANLSAGVGGGGGGAGRSGGSVGGLPPRPPSQLSSASPSTPIHTPKVRAA